MTQAVITNADSTTTDIPVHTLHNDNATVLDFYDVVMELTLEQMRLRDNKRTLATAQ